MLAAAVWHVMRSLTLLGILLFIWIGTVGMILDLLFEAAEKRWPRTKIIRQGLIVIWKLMTISAQGPHR